MKDKIMIIDGNSIINRAFYAIPSLQNKNGVYTNGIYGFLNIFFKLYEEEKPDYIAVAFDLKGPTFRHENYEDYKGTRKKMPEELRPQIPMLKDLLIKMNIIVYEKQGYEADDIIGTLGKKCERKNLDVVLVSGDKDLLQLATETIKVRIPKTKAGKTEIEDYYINDVIEKLGVTPIEYIDVKALMGDVSDNIPGVPGIGEKTAIKIIQEYKNIETAIENAINIKPKKASENLQEYKEQAILSKQLATIFLDVDVDIPHKKVTFEEIFNKDSMKILKDYEFKTIISRYSNFNKNNDLLKSELNSTFKLINSKAELQVLIDKLINEDLVGITTVSFAEKIVGISFGTKEGASFVEFSQELNEDSVLSISKVFFESKTKKILLDSKKDTVYLIKKNIHIENIIFDCLLAAYIINSSKTTYAYNDLAEDFLDITYSSEVELSGKGKNKLNFESLTLKERLNYGASHGHVVFNVYNIMINELEKNNQKDLYFNIELPLAYVLATMEVYGIKIDRISLVNFENKLTQDINKLTEEIYLLAEEEFNINSPVQMGVILFEKLGLKGSKKTTRGYSTAADILEKLRNKHPIIPKILEYRTLSKLKSTYCEGLLNVTDPNTDKIYSTFNQAVTTTGRISSTEPNLQNIPIRMELGRQLRKVFIPSDNSYIFLDADYSQIELRILAHISQDPTMIQAYINGDDIHKITASQVLKIPLEEVTPSQRNNAKAVNFGIIYGIGGFSLSQDLGITKKEADNYIAAYFEKYPKVKEYLDNSIQEAKRNGYATTLFGRRRAIPELSSSNFIKRAFGERVAMNMPIQGSAADIIKIAMIKVFERLRKENLASRLILQVHDELLLEVKTDEIDKVKIILKEEMENATSLLVPLDVDIHEGKTWFDAK